MADVPTSSSSSSSSSPSSSSPSPPSTQTMKYRYIVTAHEVTEHVREVEVPMSAPLIDILTAVRKAEKEGSYSQIGDTFVMHVDGRKPRLHLTCPRHKGSENYLLESGVALQNTYRGLPDFPGDHYAVTMSPGGPGKLIQCMKCPKCGYSATLGTEDYNYSDDNSF